MKRFLIFFGIVAIIIVAANMLISDKVKHWENPPSQAAYKIKHFDEDFKIIEDTLDPVLHLQSLNRFYSEPEYAKIHGQEYWRKDSSVYRYYESVIQIPDGEEIGPIGLAYYFSESYLPRKGLFYVEDITLNKPEFLIFKARVYSKAHERKKALELLNHQAFTSTWKDTIDYEKTLVFYENHMGDSIVAMLEDDKVKSNFSDDELLVMYAVAGDATGYFLTKIQTIEGVAMYVGALVIMLIWGIYLMFLDLFQKTRWIKYTLAFITGCFLTVFLVPIMYDVVHAIGLLRSRGMFSDLLYCVGGIGMVEELSKLLPVIIFLFIFRKMDSVELLLVGLFSALAFSFIENTMYIENYLSRNSDIIVTRGFYPTFMHLICTSIATYGFVVWRAKRRKFGIIFAYFLIAAAIHGLYDWPIINKTLEMEGVDAFVFVILFFSSFVFVSIIANCLNQSPDFDYKKSLRVNRLFIVLLYGLTSIILLNYVIRAYSEGMSEANEALFMNIFSPILLIFFFSYMLSNLDLIKGEWVNLYTFSRVAKRNKLIGKRIIINASNDSKVDGNLFPIKGIVVNRTIIDYDSNNYVVLLENPLKLKRGDFEQIIVAPRKAKSFSGGIMQGSISSEHRTDKNISLVGDTDVKLFLDTTDGIKSLTNGVLNINK